MDDRIDQPQLSIIIFSKHLARINDFILTANASIFFFFVEGENEISDNSILPRLSFRRGKGEGVSLLASPSLSLPNAMLVPHWQRLRGAGIGTSCATCHTCAMEPSYSSHLWNPFLAFKRARLVQEPCLQRQSIYGLIDKIDNVVRFLISSHSSSVTGIVIV